MCNTAYRYVRFVPCLPPASEFSFGDSWRHGRGAIANLVVEGSPIFGLSAADSSGESGLLLFGHRHHPVWTVTSILFVREANVLNRAAVVWA